MSDEKNRQAATDRFVSEVAKRIYGKKDTSDLTAWGDEGSNGYWGNTPNIGMDNYALKGLLYESDWVYIVNNLVATKISNQRLIVTKTEIVGGEKISKPAMDHELQKLLDNPNPIQTQNTLTYNWVIDLTLGGNGLVWHAKKDDTLHNIPFENVTPDVDGATGSVMRYAFNSTDDQTGQTMGQMAFAADRIMHAMKPNPSNKLWGLSPFVPGRTSILFSKYSTEFLNSFYLKGATPQLALEMDSDVNEVSSLRMLKSFEKAYGGRENQRRPIITPKGVKAKPITTSLADQQLITYINSNRETLINLLAIPKHELSIQDGAGLGSQEMRLSLRNFWLTTLKPTMRSIEGVLNKHFRDRLGDDHEIVFDLSTIEALQDDEVKKAELADRLIKSGVMSPNEVRAKIYKMDSHPDGDGLGGSNGRGLQAEPPPVIEPGERPSDGEPVRSMGMDNHHKEIASSLEKQRADDERKPRLEMENLSKGLMASFLEILIPLMKSELGDLFENTKADKRSILARLDRALARGVKEIEDEFVDSYAGINAPVAKTGFDNIVGASFDDDVADEISALSSPEKRNLALRSRAIGAFKVINKTLTEMVVAQISKGVDINKTLPQVTRGVVENFAEHGQMRAERIAKTEVGMATMLGRDGAFEDAKEILGGNLKKVWITKNDTLVRDGGNGNGNHVSLHNKPANAKGEWITGAGNTIRFPLDPMAVPQERINCRCDMIFVDN